MPKKYQKTTDWIYFILALAFIGAVTVQVFLAGAGLFSDGSYLAHHVAFMEWFQPIPVLLLVVAFIGRMPWMAKILPAVTFVALAMQYTLVGLQPHLLAGLHTVNALAIFTLGAAMIHQGWARTLQIPETHEDPT